MVLMMTTMVMWMMIRAMISQLVLLKRRQLDIARRNRLIMTHWMAMAMARTSQGQ